MSESGGSDISDIDEAITTQVEDWSSNTTEAFRIWLFRGDKDIANFAPSFTYPIFGEEEAVFGYKGLDISLSFASHNLKPHVDISWSEQWEQRGDIKASDVRGALEEFLPESAFTEESRPTAISDKDAASFSPPGTLIQSYKVYDESFEIWCASLADPLAKEMMENAQILVPLFIEGGTELELEHDWVNERWKVFFLYQVRDKAPGACPYSFVGFSSCYRVFTMPDRSNPSPSSLALLQHEGTDFDSLLNLSSAEATKTTAGSLLTPLDLPSRERISQFLILPPYQRMGHGPLLYNTMYSHLIAPDNVLELTVEDPNEEFDDMRDACDLVYLRESNDDFASLAINPDVDPVKMRSTAPIPVNDIVDGAAKQRIKSASKIMPRQFARLIEMQTYSKIPPSHRRVSRTTRKEKSSNAMDRAYYFWRLYVKQRLYDAHRDTLCEMDPEERIEKLEATVKNVEDDYDRLLACADKRAKLAASGHILLQSQDRKNRKRKVVVQDDDDSDVGAGSSDVERDAATSGSSASKKRKISIR